jgi:2-oxoglutarate dehydrogenase E2 component (dihydrolipoamide succinyltransferase)
MILSMSYDHRVIDGALAGKFLHRVKEILENFNPDIL